MAGFWGWLRGKAAPAASEDALARLLRDYLLNRPRHPGDAAQLSDAQRDDNLDQHLAELDIRLAIVSAFLRGHGVDVSPMLDPLADGVPAARSVDRWLDAVLPRRPMTILGDETPNPPDAAFRASARDGADIYYSLITDLALLEGEAIRRRDDRFRWDVNRLKSFSDMPSYHRICLMKPGARGWAPTVIDIADHLLYCCHAKSAPGGNVSGHAYGELLAGAVRRAFDPG